MSIKKLSISWLLHSLKILLGDESIRRYRILQKFPKLKHNLKKDIRTFNPFVKRRKTRQDKHAEIEKYLEYIVKLTDIVVFTATNVQRNDEDNETHYQSFIVDNDNKKVYTIDPAFNKKEEGFIGIYYAEITHDVIKPFLVSHGYEFNFVRLERPAQSTTNDVFCQSWSLLILLEILENNKYQEENLEVKIPKIKIARYKKMLDFYKDIFKSMPELQDNLQEEYIGAINDCETSESENDDTNKIESDNTNKIESDNTNKIESDTNDSDINDSDSDNNLTKEQKNQLLEIDVYDLLESMDESDM